MVLDKTRPKKQFSLFRIFSWFGGPASNSVAVNGDVVNGENAGLKDTGPNTGENNRRDPSALARSQLELFHEVLLAPSSLLPDSQSLPLQSVLVPALESAEPSEASASTGAETSLVHFSSSVRVSSSLHLSSFEIESSPEGLPSMPIEASSSVEFSDNEGPDGDSVRSTFLHLVNRMHSLLPHVEAMVEQDQFPLLGWGKTKSKVLTTDNSQISGIESSENWIFIGDLHGDFYAWYRIARVLEEDSNTKICFLGDLVDRGPYSAELFAAILEFAMRFPNRLLWIVGNHDLAIQYQDSSQRFVSFVEPAEFLDWLNPSEGLGAEECALRNRWGKLFIDIVSRLPRAVLFGDGTLAAHGGIPLKDLWVDGELNSMDVLHGDQHLSDFTFNRAVNYPFKTGWKTASRRGVNHGLEFGYQDLADFAKAVSEFFPFERFLRGHDHVENGYEIPERYDKVKLLTLNGFGFNHLNNSLQAYRPQLVYASGKHGQLPEVIALDVDPAVCADFYSDVIAAKSASE